MGGQRELVGGAVEVVDWKNYRKRTGQLTWRLATRDDLPAIEKLRGVSERFLGRIQANPDLFRPPILIALVAEDKEGRIVDLLYVEAQVEIVKMACTNQGFKEAWRLDEDLRGWLKGRGFQKVIIRTTRRLKQAMAATLEWAGFRCHDSIMSYWTRDL